VAFYLIMMSVAVNEDNPINIAKLGKLEPDEETEKTPDTDSTSKRLFDATLSTEDSTEDSDDKKEPSPPISTAESNSNATPESESGVDLKIDSASDDTEDDKSSPGNSNLGRRGDPRMHKAVAARLASPEMSLLDALIAGGFEFPDGTEGAGKSDRNVYDSENVLLCQRKNQLSRRLRLARKGAITRFSDPSMAAPKLDYRPAIGNERNMFNGNVPNLLNAPFWQPNSLPMMNGGMGMGTSRLGIGNGHVSSRAQGLMQMVLNQSNRQTSHSESDLLEARAALFANNGAMHLKYKNNGLSSPERKKMRQEQEIQNLYMPDQLGVPNFYQQGYNAGQMPSANGLIAGQMQNLQFRNQFNPSLFQNNVTAADLALHAANKEQNGIDRYYLDLAAASMGMGKDKIQSMLANNNGTSSTSAINPPNKFGPHEAVETPSPAVLQLGNGGTKSEFGSRAQETQIDIAIKFYKTERALLVQRCLLMAGFDQSEVSDDGVLCDLFEERLGK